MPAYDETIAAFGKESSGLPTDVQDLKTICRLPGDGYLYGARISDGWLVFMRTQTNNQFLVVPTTSDYRWGDMNGAVDWETVCDLPGDGYLFGTRLANGWLGFMRTPCNSQIFIVPDKPNERCDHGKPRVPFRSDFLVTTLNTERAA